MAVRPQQTGTTTPATPGGRSLTTFRVGVGALAVLVLYQATMAGQFLNGNGAALGLHEIGSHTATLVSVVIAIAGVVAWRRRQLRPAVAWSSVALPVLVYLQAHAGYARQLNLHVPLGVSLLGLSLLLLWGSTRPGLGRQ